MPLKAFLRDQIFTETGHTQILSFWFNFHPNLSSKMAEVRSNQRAIEISQNQGPFYFYFQMGPQLKIKRSQLRLTPLFQILLIKY